MDRGGLGGAMGGPADALWDGEGLGGDIGGSWGCPMERIHREPQGAGGALGVPIGCP